MRKSTALPRPCRTEWGRPKRVFRTLAEAEAFAERRRGLSAYHCQHCINYHVGHSSKDQP